MTVKPLYWRCSKCGHTGPLSMTHPLVANGRWRPGAKQKMRCRPCRQNAIHIVTEKAP